MKRDNFVLIGLLVVIVIIAIVCGYFAFQKSESDTVIETDAIRMQEEYASLNGETNSSNRQYKSVNLRDDNPYVYRTEDEIVRILTEGSGIIYFGFKSCPWCRSMVSVLADVASEKNVATIYYLDVENIRSVLSLDENNKLITEREGSSGYYKILEALDDVLEEYTLTGEDDTEIDTGEKRLYAPTVVGVLNGEIKSIHVGTVDSQTDPYADLTEEQYEELKEIYTKLIDDAAAPVCTDAC